jgi:hypothetical protein
MRLNIGCTSFCSALFGKIMCEAVPEQSQSVISMSCHAMMASRRDVRHAR